MIQTQDSPIPMRYRTRGERYDDLIVPERNQGVWDRLDAFLWGDNKLLDGLAILVCLGVMGYIIGSAIRIIF